jgi:AcrR family transcriptional regulator
VSDRRAQAAQERSRKARRRILQAAMKRIATEGLAEVSLARIAADAGVSASLLHYHFSSREELLAEALRFSFDYAGDARIGGADEADTHAGRLAAMVDQCLPVPGALERDWVLWVELWLRAVRHPELQPVAAELYARMRRWFAEAIEAGVSAGEFAACDAGRVADRALALIDGFGLRALLGDAEIPLELARREVGALLARDLGLAGELPFAGRLAGARTARAAARVDSSAGPPLVS